MCALKEKEKLCSLKKREAELHMKVSQFCIWFFFFFLIYSRYNKLRIGIVHYDLVLLV